MNQLPPPLPTGLKDRKTSLTIFGILTMMGGFLCALFLLPMLAHTANVQGATPHSNHAVLFACLMYGGLGVTLVWLGVGSILARRWARALLLILSWGALITGLVAGVMLGVMSGTIFENIRAAASTNTQVPESALWVGLLVAGGFLGVLFILLPAIWIFFYSRKSVKATCEARDPQERWTDRAPLPVVAASLFLCAGALCIFSTFLMGRGAIAFFGVYLSGIPGMLVSLILCLIWLYAARAMFRLEVRGWWVAFVSMILFPISAALTFHRLGVSEFYSRAGYSEAELAQIQNLPFMQGNNMFWFMLFSALPWLAFLLFVKTYFRQK